MSKWNMIVDVERCNNCYNCFVGTKDEYVDNEYKGYTCLLYTSPSPRDRQKSRMPSSA